ncbi:MAG: hypothetical protein VB934_10355, partial [Polyangiaceae bacterium]
LIDLDDVGLPIPETHIAARLFIVDLCHPDAGGPPQDLDPEPAGLVANVNPPSTCPADPTHLGIPPKISSDYGPRPLHGLHPTWSA